MTYPPQQPAPYGQQPGSYGPQPGGAFPPSGPQHQHGYQSETRQDGQPGQYGQSWGQQGWQNAFGADPGGTQQFPHSDPYGQPQDSYGQQQTGYDPYGQQSGFSDGGPPRKKKTGLIAGIAIAAVLVVGGVVALIVVNSGSNSTEQAQVPASGVAPPPSNAPATTSQSKPSASRSPKPTSPSSSPSSPSSSAAGSGPAPGGKADVHELATAVVAAYNAGDGKGVAKTVCRSLSPQDQVTIKPGLHVTASGGVTQTGQTAKMPIKATLNGQTDFGFVGFKQESGLWCFTGATQS
jgi:hypothetical protein